MATPVLWLCGPPGVGKSTVGWELYRGLVAAGVQAGYVDIDQVGIHYPEPASDPGRHRLKARNLRAVIAGHRAAGVRCVVVSGVVDPVAGVPVGELPDAAVTVCRLRADPARLRQRFVGRGVDVDLVEEALRDAAALDDSTVAAVCVDTTDLSVAQVVRRVRERTGWPPPPPAGGPARAGARPTATGDTPEPAAGPVLWLCGPVGVGTSTIGFVVYVRTLRAGHTATYVDLGQIGLCGPAPAGHPVLARILADLWRTCRAAGARRLVIVGPVDDRETADRYAAALAPAPLTLCRLHAAPDELTRRVLTRGTGGSWPQPGDPLVGRSTGHLLGVAERSIADDRAWEAAALGLRVDTTGLSVEEAADRVLAGTGWPG